MNKARQRLQIAHRKYRTTKALEQHCRKEGKPVRAWLQRRLAARKGALIRACNEAEAWLARRRRERESRRKASAGVRSEVMDRLGVEAKRSVNQSLRRW